MQDVLGELHDQLKRGGLGIGGLSGMVQTAVMANPLGIAIATRGAYRVWHVSGTPPRSKMLGHASYVTTLTVYADYITESDGGKAARLRRPVPSTAANVVPMRGRSG